MLKALHIVAAGLVLLPGLAAAAEPSAAEALAKKNGCFACHTIQKKVIGPAYKDVAERYDGEKGAVDKLVHKVKEGGGGVWGSAGMPPQPQMKDEEIRRVVEWILTLK
ncbi:c-type cytochrome [Pseudogulbenkiania sp. MAI-1]|uniref:c-type cytochrome n=1 Tax=Pseudogulbenkiania sp. MAI-1 TaxID=990370 RepID=UPI00045E7FF0|nr:c-type cytochrome [Pseudogulbenkiania sp. MAI-1]